jgi:feruloyl-CoA synthase
MRLDHALRDRFFSRVEMLFYAGAGLSQATWNMIDELAMASVGKKIRMLAGLGMTETAPSAMFSFAANARSGEVGIPVPGCRVKLAPVDGKLEARFSGPNVMKGYWRTPELNQGVFDDEGFFCTGDALKPMDGAAPERGFLFDGRLAEDFKLSSGTFVSVGPLRARVIAAGAPLIQDVVLAGLNRDDLSAIIFPRADLCIKLASDQGEPCASLAEALSCTPVRSAFLAALTAVNQQATGSASRIERAIVVAEPPSMDRGEVTDKGSINQRAVLSHRSALVDAMYAGTADHMIVLKTSNHASEKSMEKNKEMVRD